VPLPFDFPPPPVAKLTVEHVLTCAGSGPCTIPHAILFSLIDSISRWVDGYAILSDGWEKIHEIYLLESVQRGRLAQALVTIMYSF
jgi:hypothetical protein